MPRLNVPKPTDPPWGRCDWGDCDEPSVAWRRWRTLSVTSWLPVCEQHRGGVIFGPDDDAAVGRWVREHQAVEWCDDAGLPLRYGEVGHANDHVAMVGRYRAAALAAVSGTA